jgi:type IV secretory pathway protease TraF
MKDPRYHQPVYPLKVPADSVFAIGDKYDNSLDSRYLGTIPLSAITHSAKRVVGPAGHAGKIE